MKDVSVLIPARGGSKRIPNKNLIDFCGMPLIYYSISEAKKITDRVYVSTDSPDIAAISKRCGATVINRPQQYAEDTSCISETIFHFLKEVSVDIFVLMQATSPLLRSEYVERGIKMMSDYDSVISVNMNKNFFWDKNSSPVNFVSGRKPRTQDMGGWYAENGAFYITTKNNFFATGDLSNGRVGFVEMRKLESIDIDDYEDLDLARLCFDLRESRREKDI